MKLSFHPASELFPLLDGAEFESLKADIAAHGQRETIRLFGGKILDGRNRYRACCELKLEPRTEEWRGKGTPEEFVLSENLHRRHLSESQRSMIAGRLANLEKHKHKPDTPIGESNDAVSQDDAAEMLNVAPRSVQRAAVILANGTPKLAEMVEADEISVSAAATLATLPKEDQKRIVEQGPEAVKTMAKVIRDEAAAAFPNGSKSPRQETEDDPGLKWTKTTYALLVRVNGVRTLGGMKELSADWPDKVRRSELRSLREIRDAIDGWITALEDANGSDSEKGT